MADAAPFSQLVVVGSSAGGIEALGTLVGTLPVDLRAPVVVAQHLHPSRESHLGEILSRAGMLPVRTVTEIERLEPGVVYVVPANRDVEITDHEIRLRTGSQRSQPSIDRLFSSAADVYGENLIAIVLSGMGTDGVAGVLDVHEAGGTVIVQDPLTASFPALPRALAPSAIDCALPIEEIGSKVHALLTADVPEAVPGEEGALDRLLRFIRERRGLDFRSYKPATITRRVQRHLDLTGTQTIAEYLQYLQRHPEEEQALIADFLIKVTKFFRDAALFEDLKTRILPEIVQAARERDRTLRIWSSGCATGEEAYSLAILLAEVLGEELEHFRVRIFATDLDAGAIAFARQGLFSLGSLAGLDGSLMDRYFDVVDGGYQISKRIRSLMVFGEHDLAERAPFPHVDLVLCRNVLIYFTPELQHHILQLFAFALRDGGYLVLGKSETTSAFPDAYAADDARMKVYRRHGDQVIVPMTSLRGVTVTAPSLTAPLRSSPTRRQLSPQPTPPREPVPGARPEEVVFDLAAGVVIVDRRYDISYINAAARTFLGIHSSALGEDVIHLARTVDPAQLRALIDRALASEAPVRDTLPAHDGSGTAPQYLEVVCEAMTDAETGTSRVTVCFWDVTRLMLERLDRDAALEQTREELVSLEQQRDHLLATNEELLVANGALARDIAVLQSQNEEYVIGNEELQAGAEEVETLNEELQATNEELETLNEELQATVEELNTTNDDLEARNVEVQDLAAHVEAARARLRTILNSLPEAVVLIDAEGTAELTNARYDEVFSAPLETLDLRTPDGQALPPDQSLLRRGARGESFQMTIIARRPDGGQAAYEVIGRPLHGYELDGGGGVLMLRGLPQGAPSG